MGTVVYYGILILTIAVILGLLGVPSTTIAGVLGVVTIVLAITLQASLGNLAAAVNFMLFKPFEVGDFIQTAGIMGIVQEMQLFSNAHDHLQRRLNSVVIASRDASSSAIPSGQ
jgi:small conductance mechanosensitive channel